MSKLQAIIGGAVLAVVFMVGVWLGNVLSKPALAQAREQIATITRDLKDAEAKAERAAREKEQAIQSAADEAATARKEADDQAAKLIAERDRALSSGTLRVRERFSCPSQPVAGVVPQAAGSAAGAEQAVPRGFGEADARAALGIADEGDFRTRLLNQCIGILHGERK